MNPQGTPPAQWRGVVIGTAFVGVVVFVLCFFVLRKKDADTSPASPRQPGAVATEPQRSDSVEDVLSVIGAAGRDLRSTSDPTRARTRLDGLRRSLQGLPPNIASAGIRAFLDSKADAVSHGQFKAGADGFLMESSSLRVFLLDSLAQVDPATAAAYATTIFSSMESPDEWAVALRNCAKGNPTSEGRSFLERKLQAMLTHEPWVEEPSDGFLEAFDVAVYVGGTNIIPTLTGLLRMKDNQAVAHAAYLALDRLTISDVTTTLSMLRANPELMQGREETRATFFARADVREPAQRQLLEQYLLDPALDAAELEKFAGLYPNANYMISHNLLTHVVTPDGAWLKAGDAESLSVLQQWLEDPRFERLKPTFERIRRRLESFVQQSSGSP